MNEKKFKFLIFTVTKSWVASKFRKKKRDTIKRHYKPYMVKKTIYPGTRGRKSKVLKKPIDLTGINKVPIVG